jgi:hypothetical protein
MHSGQPDRMVETVWSENSARFQDASIQWACEQWKAQLAFPMSPMPYVESTPVLTVPCVGDPTDLDNHGEP